MRLLYPDDPLNQRKPEDLFAAEFDIARARGFAALHGRNWPGYFVKDYVKSLSTGIGSLVQAPEEIPQVVSRIKKYRGAIEGGMLANKRAASAGRVCR